MLEIDGAQSTRARVNALIEKDEVKLSDLSPTENHILQGLALTVGSALGQNPPTKDECRTAFTVPNKAGLTAGARAWSKHAHRSIPESPSSSFNSNDISPLKSKPNKKNEKELNTGWWGSPRGPVALINDRAVSLFDRIMQESTWRNLHWLPHGVLVYEVRIAEGYGMRWSKQCQSDGTANEMGKCLEEGNEERWVFRGFVEPMMENGHEVGWQH